MLLSLFLLRVRDYWQLPQFWAEDGATFFHDSFCYGAKSLFLPYAGYFHLAPRLTALLSTLWQPLYAPVIYFWTSIALTALVVFLVLSPRLSLPFRPLLAFAIITVPNGAEVCGNITNIQWYLAIGTLTILLMEPSEKRSITACEAMYVITAGLTGPFTLFLAPLFVARLLLHRKNPVIRQRLIVLTLFALLAACIQVVPIVAASAGGMFSNSTHGTQSVFSDSNYILLVIPAQVALHLGSPFISGFCHIVKPVFSTISVCDVSVAYIAMLLFVLSVIAIQTMRGNYVFENLSFLYFSAILLAAAYAKSDGHVNDFNAFNIGGRYFFIPNILLYWSLLLAIKNSSSRSIPITLLLLASLSMTVNFNSWPREDLHWREWITSANKSDAKKIPINPRGWTIDMSCR